MTSEQIPFRVVDGGPQLHLMIVHHVGEPSAVQASTAEHVAYLTRNHAAGTFLVSGQTVPADWGGAIIAVGISREEAERIAATDPFVQAGVSRYEIVTLKARRLHPELTLPSGTAQ